MTRRAPKSVEKLASDYITAAAFIGQQYETATREEANKLDRELDVLAAQLARVIWNYGTPVTGRTKR